MARALRSLLSAAFMLACGASCGTALAQSAAAPQRGQLLEAPQPVGTYSGSDLIARLTNGTITRKVLQAVFSPTCSVAVYHLQYETVGGRGEPTNASAALMIPIGSDASCQGPRPLILYAHGNRNLRQFDIADLSSASNYEGLLLALACAAHGYIVIEPNYAGYDVSTLSYHPYLVADQQAADMIDALAAARAALVPTASAENGKLFVTGYSEGGFVAMATHRAMQAAGIPVTASAPMSGPYALTAFGDAVFMGQVSAGAADHFVMLASSYQNTYGNLFAAPTDLFEPKYASSVGVLPTTIGIPALLAQGALPATGALFDNTPPTPGLASVTPATAPASLASVFAAGFAPDHLITNDYRLSYLTDAIAEPDGGFPNTTTTEPPQAPGNALRVDLARNDLRNWAPTAPVLLCGGHEDPVVFYLNTQLMQAYWAQTAPESPVTILDVDSSASPGDPYQHVKEGFAAAKSAVELQGLLSGGLHGARAAVLGQYHTVLVSTFCTQAVRSFFDAH